jgi:hypothetical protein
MKNLFFILLFSFIFSQANGQNANVKSSSSNLNVSRYTGTGDMRTSGFWMPGAPIENSIKGTVYLFPDFKGQYKVISKNGNSFNLLNLNYNLKTKTLETFVSKDSVFQYELGQIGYVLTNNNKYKVNSDGNLKGLSLEIYNSDKVQFFKYFHVISEKAVINPMTNVIISEAEYTQVFTYFLYQNGKEVKIKLNKNDVLNALIDKKNAVKEYVKSNKLVYSSEMDICKILKYYESI